MNGTWIRLTRSELHQKVWAAPIKTVAQELGVSASSLTTACRKHNIPLPSVGHWTKVEVGHKITPAPLVAESGGNEAVQIHIRERLSPELAALAAENPPQVQIPQELSHALALRTEKLLASGKENDRKLIVPKAGTAPHLHCFTPAVATRTADHECTVFGSRRTRLCGFMAQERGRTLDGHCRC